MDEIMYVMHHAPVAKRKGEIIGSRTDSALSKYGVEIANRQADKVRNMLCTAAFENEINGIISSPLKRAIQTSEIIATRCKLDVMVDDRLKAQDFGILDGMTFDEIYRDDVLKLNLWDYVEPNDRDNHRVPEGESNFEMVSRVNAFNADMLSENTDSVPLIITHGTVIDALIAIIDHKRLDEIEGKNRRYEGRPIGFTNRSYQPMGVSGEQFDYIPGVAELLRDNDTSGVKNCIRHYLTAQNVRDDEKIYLEKLLTFYL